MKKCLLLIIILAQVFFLQAEPTEEDATLLSIKYEALSRNFIQFHNNLVNATNGEAIASVINLYVLENEQLFEDIRNMSEPFKNETWTFRLKRAVENAQTAMKKMNDIGPLIEPYLGDDQVVEAWIGFVRMFGLEAKI